MRVSVVMPQLGLTMTEGTVSEWIKKPGERVEKGEFLFTASTDKADMEVESMAEGTLSEIVVEIGKAVPVGTVIAYIEKAGAENAPSGRSAETAARGQVPEPLQAAGKVPSPQSEVPRKELVRRETPAASPRARRVARELGVDLASVQGTGTAGRIVEEDVRRAAQTTPTQGAENKTRRRQLIAEKMLQSTQTIPHFTVSVEVNAKGLLDLLESLKGPVKDSTGVKLTVTDLLLKALAMVLTELPGMNATWEEEKIRPCNSADLALAAATEEGVVGPVIHNVGKLEVGAIAQRRSDLVDKARRRRLSLRDLEGGVGTLSNLGMYQIDQFQAMITPGQSFVLAVGQIRERPWVEGAALTVRPTMILSLSVDHRVADGAVAAEFIRKVANIIEHPERIGLDFRQEGGKERNR
ncbi:MAG TPA: dihydrolipoamide acetyltransferase family protein [Terriglobia bacterium]|nr:dihydrolipoamide acetyltransferase family protein [Terriglobia bacterium]